MKLEPSVCRIFFIGSASQYNAYTVKCKHSPLSIYLSVVHKRNKQIKEFNTEALL